MPTSERGLGLELLLQGRAGREVPSCGACTIVTFHMPMHPCKAATRTLSTSLSPPPLGFIPCRVRSVPPALLTGCTSLQSLSLHNNPITMEQLRETPGYAELDARRRAKYDKQASRGWLLRGRRALLCSWTLPVLSAFKVASGRA